jgi:erythromycin esterase-like protein
MILDPRAPSTRTRDGQSASLVRELRHAARPLVSPSDLDPLMDLIGDARFVLLGEATHGTAEFYHWRADLSKRLIREKGFSFMAVEGDWPDCYRVNRHVAGMTDPLVTGESILHAFERWPTWMWANRQIVELVDWMREHNRRAPEAKRVGFYGLDVYSLWDSMAAVVAYLERVDRAAAAAARQAYACFDPYYEDAQAYAMATALVPTSCERETIEMLSALREHQPEYPADGTSAYFNAEQNALIARNAERYYRTMIRGGPASWNLRDRHMVETLNRLMRHHGPHSKAIVWEHNTHVGDARFTDMAREGMLNVGQLVREDRGERPDDRDGVVLVGFGTHRGSVIAAGEWGEQMQRMRMPIAREGSLEDLLHEAIGGDGLLLFDGTADGGIPGLDAVVDHRAVGVIYHPRAERWGNYVPTIVPRRYDAFLFVDETRAVDPLHLPARIEEEAPETYPTGM